MKFDKSDFASFEKLEIDMEMIQKDAMNAAITALQDGIQKVFDEADKKKLSDKEYIKEIISGACGSALFASSLHTTHMISNYFPIILEMAYQTTVERIESQL
ncbi:hypothetical protein [Bacillus altitudinis]|uniref:hypothetical protein n=1 Tax=Bacillus altitudinis TaxID=293387 RepID=UPI00064C8A3D|nr:hypothetical protein [Bacillus altitudinis]KLV22280.1 hypothetical protein ABW03_10775 [Bacillus altitudinis]